MTTETPPLVRSRLSERVRAVPPSGIRKFFDVIATMPDVISLGVGEPDFTTPPQVVEEGVRSLRSGRTHYTSNYGTIELRRGLASHLQRLYGLDYNPETEICITVGASEAVAAAMCAITDPGDEVAAARAVVRRVPARDPVQRRHACHHLDHGRDRLCAPAGTA